MDVPRIANPDPLLTEFAQQPGYWHVYVLSLTAGTVLREGHSQDGMQSKESQLRMWIELAQTLKMVPDDIEISYKDRRIFLKPFNGRKDFYLLLIVMDLNTPTFRYDAKILIERFKEEELR